MYNGNLSKSTQLQTAYIKAVGNQNHALGNYLAGLNGANASMGGYIKSLIGAKAATIGLQVASVALNATITMGISLAISALVTQIQKWANAQEDARKKSVELTNSYKEQQSSLESQIEKYKELKDTLDDGNLSTDEARSIKEQLLEIQQSLIESYGDEASNIDLVNGKYREQLGLLGELSKEKATEYVTENRDVFADAKEALEKERTYNLGTVTSWNDYSPQTEDQKKLLDYIEAYSELLDLTYTGATGRGVSATSVSVSVKADVASADELMHQFATDLEKYGQENDIDVSGILEGISGQLKETWTDELTEYKTVYDEFMKAEIVRNDTLRPLYQESIQAVEDYNKALSTGEGIEEAKANLESVQQSVQSATGELEGSQGVFDGIYEGINKDAEAAYNLGKAFENDKTVQNYAEQLRGLTDIDLKAINFNNDNTEKGEEAFKGLMETLGLTEEQVQSLINKLVELGYVQGEVQGSTSDNEITVFSGFSEEQTKAIDDFQSKVKTLGDTLSSLQSGEDIDFTDLIQEFPELQGKSENLEKAIKELIENEWKKLQETLGEGLPSDAKDDLQEYVDTTINASVSLSDAFSSIQKSYEALNDFKSAMSTGMTDDVLNSVGSLSSELNDLVAGFYAGTVTSQELFDALSKHYETDLENYGNALIAKNALSYEFYNSVGLTDTTLINSFKENYGVDISNCKSYNEAKIKIEQQTLGIIGKMWSQFYNAQTQTFTAEMDALEAQIETDPYAEELYSKIKSQTNAYETAIAALNNIVYEGIGTDFEAIGGNLIKNKNSGSDKEDSKSETKETIDWIERYNEMLQKQHDILDEIANDETQSYNERIGALDEMIAKDKERIDIAQKSAQEYKEAWDKAIEGLSNKDISNIMNGSLDIETYDESVLGEEYIDKLKEAMDLYDKFLDMKQKVSDVEKESLDHMREQLKLEEEIIQAEQELIDAKRSVTDANLDYIEASGGVVNAGLYKQQIALSKELESTYHDQIANLAEQIELVDEGSAEYYSLLAAMDDCQAAIIDCQTEQAELNEAIARIPIERLQKYINMLRNIKTDLQNFLDEQSALGINPTADQLQQLIDLSHKEISKLTEQQKELSGLLETYEYGSEKFNEVQDEIQNIDDEISSLIQNQREWNTELLNIPIENLEKVNDNLSTYSSILGEQIDEQEKAHNAVISHLDREIEKYEELKDAVNDKYDPEIEAIQEKLDLLDKTNEKLSIQQRLEQANYDYNKALNNKNILTINEKGEQEYISDIDALREATVEKQEAELAKLKFDLNESKELLEEQKQKELDALDAEIERIENIQDVWTKVKEEVESISDILSANNVLGSNWQNIVLAGGTENEDLANSWASMYETLTTQKDSVDKQIESNERIISMMNEFVERFNSGALTYEQALNGVNELSHNIEKGYTAMEQLVDMMNLDGIKDLSGISSSADSQIVDSVDLLRDYLGVANDNNIAINEIAKTWTEMQQSIQDQLAELKRLADELAKKQAQETTVKFVSDNYSSRNDDDDDDNYVQNDTYVVGGPGGTDKQAIADAVASGKDVVIDVHDEDEREMWEDYIDSLPRHHSGVSLGTVGNSSSRGKKDNLFQAAAENILKPAEKLVIAKEPEMLITPEQRDNLLKNIGYFNMYPTISKPNLDILSNRDVSKSIEVHMGNIVLEGVQDPDGFARAMKAQFGPLLRQEMSKVK